MSADNGVPEKENNTTAAELDPHDLDGISGGGGSSEPGESYGGGARPPTWGGYDPD